MGKRFNARRWCGGSIGWGTLKPTKAKVALAVALTSPIFLLVYVFLSPICADPTAEAWTRNPDPEIWGCHTALHRIFRFVPDFIAVTDLPSTIFLSLTLSYLTSSLIVSAISALGRALKRADAKGF